MANLLNKERALIWLTGKDQGLDHLGNIAHKCSAGYSSLHVSNSTFNTGVYSNKIRSESQPLLKLLPTQTNKNMVSKKKITIDIPFLSVFRSTIMSGI
jgi:hypothetical protein